MPMPYHNEPDPPSTTETVNAADAAAAAMDAALSDQPLPELPEALPPVDADPNLEKPKDEAKPTDDPDAALAEALADKPADAPETPEAKAAREQAEKDAAGEPELDKDGKPVIGEDGKPKVKAKAEPPAKDDAVEKEMVDLNIIGERQQKRFRELSAVKAEYEPIRAVLAEVGVKTPEQVKGLVTQAQDAHFIVQQVEATGMGPEQYFGLLNYGALAVSMSKGDMAAAEQAFEMLGKEYAVVANLLGKEVPGLVDPLKAYPDLQAELDDELITRARALEIAKTRNAEALRTGNADAAAKASQAKADQDKAVADAREAGKVALDNLPAKLAATDPGGVEALKAKYPDFVAKVTEIVQKFPPDKWELEATRAYLAIAAPAKAPAPPNFKGTGSAIPSSGPTPFLAPDVTDPMAALNIGLDSLAQGG